MLQGHSPRRPEPADGEAVVAAPAYETEAARLTLEQGDFDCYELAARAGSTANLTVRAAKRWIRRRHRTGWGLRRTAAATYGPGADPARYAVTTVRIREIVG